jgi:hypothetical protein
VYTRNVGKHVATEPFRPNNKVEYVDDDRAAPVVPESAADLATRAAYSTVAAGFAAMGFDLEAKTDPAVMKALIEEHGIDGATVRNAELKRRLKALTEAPQPAGALLVLTQRALADNPVVVRLFRTAIEKRWLEDLGSPERALNLAYLWELLTFFLLNDHRVAEDLSDQFRTGLRRVGLPLPSPESETDGGPRRTGKLRTFIELWRRHDLFGAAKYLSVTPVYSARIHARGFLAKLDCAEPSSEQVDAYVEDNELSGMTQEIFRKIFAEHPHDACRFLRLNIDEAAVVERSAGFTANSRAAFMLNEQTRSPSFGLPRMRRQTKCTVPEGVEADPTLDPHGFYDPEAFVGSGANFLLEYTGATREWTRLYNTWNGAFVLCALHTSEDLIAKLMIPSVVDKSGPRYMPARACCLWLAMQLRLRNFMTNGNYSQAQISEPALKIAAELGRLNSLRANELARELGLLPEELTRRTDHAYRWGRAGILRMGITDFLR